MFMGGLLLLAAILTWGIGLMMSPHGETVAKGTEHVRTTVVTFMRNGAIGTLILTALSAWLLFPARRPKWPARDWVLIVVLVFLAGSSLYTLVWLQFSVLH
jgi:drug/metabolite transporter (DMT)-like permease